MPKKIRKMLTVVLLVAAAGSLAVVTTNITPASAAKKISGSVGKGGKNAAVNPNFPSKKLKSKNSTANSKMEELNDLSQIEQMDINANYAISSDDLSRK